jgi:hypothetical protein
MDKCIDDNLTDLHIISLIKEGVKIYVRNGRIAHQQPKGENVLQNMWGSTKRWFYNDNRRSGVDEIYNIVKQGIKIVQGLESDKFYCKKYIELLPKVIEGINNYKKTYSEDSYMQSRCNVIINGIQSIKK